MPPSVPPSAPVLGSTARVGGLVAITSRSVLRSAQVGQNHTMAGKGSDAHLPCPTPDLAMVSGGSETPGVEPTGPPAFGTDGFGVIFFFLLKDQPSFSVPVFSRLGHCLCRLYVPRAPRGRRLFPSRAPCHAGTGQHISMEVGQPGKVTPSLFSGFPPHCHLQDTAPSIPGNPHPGAKLGIAQISQRFRHFQSWQNYR